MVLNFNLSNKRKYNFKELSQKVISWLVIGLPYKLPLITLSDKKNSKNFLLRILNLMRDKLYDNADSFAMSFDEEWEKINCEDLKLKIDKVFELLSDHPFLMSNPKNARKLAEFRIFSLKKLK